MALHYYARQWISEHQVHVIAVHSPNILELPAHVRNPLPSNFVLDGVRISNRTMLRLPGGLNVYPSFLPEFIEQFDLLIGHMPVGAALAWRLSKKFEKPFIQGIHYTDFKRSGVRSGILSRKYNRMLSHASAISFRSSFLQGKFEAVLPEISSRSFLMSGGVDSIWLEKPGSRVFDFAENDLNVLTVAQLIERKNIDKVIGSLKAIKSADWEYRVVGSGPQRDRLLGLSERSGVDMKISFEGFLSNHQVMDQMDHSDVFVMISEHETFGLVYLEAMARGCLVIATSQGGVAGIVKDGENGFLCDPNEEALSAVLNRILKMSPSQLSKISAQAKNTAEKYTYPILSNSYLENLDLLLH